MDRWMQLRIKGTAIWPTKETTVAADVPGYLYESGRCAIAHAYANPIVDPGDTDDLRRLSQDLEVVKAIAAFVISVEFGVSRSILG